MSAVTLNTYVPIPLLAVWAFNLFCAIWHALFAYLIFTACGGTRFGVKINPNCTGKNMEVPVVRFGLNWTSRSAGGYRQELIDNELPIRFDLAAGWFHALSLIFHLAIVVLGPFEAFSWLYWKQLDRCFCWWRCAHVPRAWFTYADVFSCDPVCKTDGQNMRPRHL